MNFKHKCSPNHPGKHDRKCRRGILADYKVCMLLLFGSAKSRPQHLWPPWLKRGLVRERCHGNLFKKKYSKLTGQQSWWQRLHFETADWLALLRVPSLTCAGLSPRTRLPHVFKASKVCATLLSSPRLHFAILSFELHSFILYILLEKKLNWRHFCCGVGLHPFSPKVAGCQSISETWLTFRIQMCSCLDLYALNWA